MEQGWVKAFETTLPYRAHIVQAMLEEHDIEAVVINKQDSALVSIGKQELYVPEEKLLKAIQLITHGSTGTAEEEE